MVRPLRQITFALCTALMLAVLSVVSAYQMAPDRDEAARLEAFRGLVVSAEDICGLTGSSHEHSCPFCHKLPDAPKIAAPDLQRRIAQVVTQSTECDLVLGPQYFSAHVSVRAPPFLI